MTALSIQVPYQIFADSDGTPLDNGYVWIGTTNLDPRTNPINVYFDAALTQVAPNPLRTINGYVYNAGSPAQLYIDGVNFSIRVEDKKSVLVYSFPSGSGISPDASGVVYLPAGTGAVATNVQSKLRESVSVKDFGAVGDGVTDDTTSAVTDTEINAAYSLVVPGTYNVRQTPITAACGFKASSPVAKFRNNTNDERVLWFSDNGASKISRVTLEGMQISDGGTDTTDNSAAVFSSGVDYSRYIGNIFSPSVVGVSSQYGSDTLGPYVGSILTEARPLCQSTGNVYAFNDVDASSMGYEFFSALRHRIVGNNAYRTGSAANSHAYRFTGYTGMPCDYNVFVGNTADKYATGLSVQTATHYNNFAAFSFSNITSAGVSLNKNTTYSTDHNGFNYYQGVVNTTVRAVYGDNPAYNFFNIIARNCSGDAIWLDKTPDYGDAQHNIVDAIVKDSLSAGVFETDNGIIRITAADLTSNALTISGSNNIVDFVVDGLVNASGRFSLVISGNKNIVRCVAVNNSSPATSDISITGNDNDVTVYAATGTSCSGARNTIRGHLGNVTSLVGSVDTVLEGTISSMVRGGTNTDYSRIRNGSGRNQISTTTDASGEATVTVTGIPTGMTTYGATAQFLNFSANRYVVVKSCSVAANTLTIVLRFRNDDGTAAASTAVFAFYEYFAY